MSDTDSIVFHEHSDIMSINSISPSPLAGPRQTKQPSQNLKITADTNLSATEAMFEKPPLPISFKPDSLRSRSTSPKEGTRPVTQLVNSTNEDNHDEQSESIQFHLEIASRNMSMGSLPGDNVSFTQSGLPLSLAQLGRPLKRRTGAPSDIHSESIRFTVEDSESLTHPLSVQGQQKGSKQLPSANQRIQFRVGEGSIGGEALKHTLRSDAKERKSSAHHMESSASTILFDVEESSLERKSEPKTSDKAKVIPQKKTVVSNRFDGRKGKIGFAHPPTLRVDVPPQGSALVQHGAPSPLATMNSESLRVVNTTQTHEHQRQNSGGHVTTDVSGRTPIVHSQGETADVHSTLVANPKRDAAKTQKPNRNYPRPDEKLPQTQKPQKEKTTRRSSATHELMPTAEQNVPTSHLKSLPVHHDDNIDGELMRARLYTEHWRFFNDIQRDEIDALVRRIIEARRADRIPLMSSKYKEGQRSTTAVASHSTTAVLTQRNSTKAALPGTYHMAHQRRQELPKQTTIPKSYRTLPASKFPGADAGQVAPRTKIPTVVHKKKSPLSAAFIDQARDAPKRLALSLGVAWPPRTRDELFFLTGARLTPQQCSEFYEALNLQVAASGKLHAEIRQNFEEEIKKKKTRCYTKPKASRTFILRKAFDLMDADRKGEILAEELPALRLLLESERRQMEKTVDSESTLLARARNELKHLKGSVDTRTRCLSSVDFPVASPAAACAMLYTFVIDVILPLLEASGMMIFDFSTIGLLVFGSLVELQKRPTVTRAAWCQEALRHFEALA